MTVLGLLLAGGLSRRMGGGDKSLRPLHDRVLIKRLEQQDERHGSIIIPDTAKEKPQEGQVIAVGTGKVVTLAGLGTPEHPHPLRRLLSMSKQRSASKPNTNGHSSRMQARAPPALSRMCKRTVRQCGPALRSRIIRVWGLPALPGCQ